MREPALGHWPSGAVRVACSPAVQEANGGHRSASRDSPPSRAGPDLLDDLPADHRSYSQRIEARLKWLTKQVPGHRLSVSPLTVAELVEAHGADANTGEARSSLAAEVARSGRALDWPPARNGRCWCGSGQKYKKCCGPVPPAEDEE